MGAGESFRHDEMKKITVIYDVKDGMLSKKDRIACFCLSAFVLPPFLYIGQGWKAVGVASILAVGALAGIYKTIAATAELKRAQRDGDCEVFEGTFREVTLSFARRGSEGNLLNDEILDFGTKFFVLSPYSGPGFSATAELEVGGKYRLQYYGNFIARVEKIG